MPRETFPLHFEGCEHVLNIPLLHNPDHSRCYLCHPELRIVTCLESPKCMGEPERESKAI